MSLTPYTNTYVDTDGSIADADDILNEFQRVADFIDIWSDSYESIGLTDVKVHSIVEEGNTDIVPTDGIVQTIQVGAGIESINVNIKAREEGDPYRIYLTLRFGAKSTTFTTSVPAGKSHIFGLNRAVYSPSQVVDNGWYNSMLVITYGTDASHVAVFANNAEVDAVSADDVFQEIAV